MIQRLIIVDDYHEFNFIADAIIGNVRHIELGSIVPNNSKYTKYLGVIYEGKPPTNEEISDLLFRAKITKIDDGYVQK